MKLKRPNPELAELIRVVNLTSGDEVTPTKLTAASEAEFMAWLKPLNGGLRDYLVDYLSGLQKGKGEAFPVRLLLSFVAERYEEIVAARDGFDSLFSHKRWRAADQPFVGSHIPTACRLTVNEGKVDVSLSWFGRAVLGAELEYLRQCEIETCGKIFYAGRKNQHCCTVQCAKKRRQQKWRQKYGKPVLTEQEQQELAHRKTKRADPAGKR